MAEQIENELALARESLVLKALAHPVRLRIVQLLADKKRWGLADEFCCSSTEVCVCKITGIFDLSMPTVSHHLKLLREAGLVETRREGVWIYYALKGDVLRKLSSFLLTLMPAGACILTDETPRSPRPRPRVQSPKDR